VNYLFKDNQAFVGAVAAKSVLKEIFTDSQRIGRQIVTIFTYTSWRLFLARLEFKGNPEFVQLVASMVKRCTGA
jgi:predicted transcriptional regulator